MHTIAPDDASARCLDTDLGDATGTGTRTVLRAPASPPAPDPLPGAGGDAVPATPATDEHADEGGPDDGPLPAGVLGDIAAGLARARTLWQAAVRYEPDGRDPVRLLATDRYEAWVIGWLPGQGVSLHDHGDSAGHFRVVAGELTEVLATRRGNVDRSYETGSARFVPVGAVHDVVNRTAEPAISIHIYSPPITRMTYYGDDGAPTATEHIASADPILGKRAPSFLLHPANRG